MSVAIPQLESTSARIRQQRRISTLRLIRATARIIADIISLFVGFLIGAFTVMLFSQYFTGNSFNDLLQFTDVGARAGAVGLFGGLLIGWFFHSGHYSLRLPHWTEVRQILTGCCLALLGDGFLQFALKNDFSRLWLVNSWLATALAIIMLRWLLRAFLSALGVWRIRALVVGQASHCPATVAGLQHDWGLGYEVVGEFALEDLEVDCSGAWSRLCQQHGAEMVVLAADDQEMAMHGTRLARLALERIPFTCIQSLRGLPVVSVEAHHVVGHDVLMLSGFFPMSRPLSRLSKQIFDYGAALLLLIVAVPLFVLIALLVARDGGSVFYSHMRVGHHGRHFRCLKFRTMVPDAAAVLETVLANDPAARAEWEATRKLRNDVRITRWGHFLRRYSLDELPQLLNVLRGEMSLVGPRPLTDAEMQDYGDGAVFYLEVKPGITGLWQVSGRNDLDVMQRNDLNSWYVKNWSFWLDVTILLRTIPTVLGRKGAY